MWPLTHTGVSYGILYFNNGENFWMGRFPDASSYVCKSMGLRGFEFQLYIKLNVQRIKKISQYAIMTLCGNTLPFENANFTTYWIRLLNCCSVSKEDKVSSSIILSFSIPSSCEICARCTFARSLECVVTLKKYARALNPPICLNIVIHWSSFVSQIWW